MIEEQIKKYALALQPKECVGLIVENPETHKVRAITFEGQSDNQHNYASLRSLSYIRAKRTDNILAVFHSHCGVDEKPSKVDITYSEELHVPYYIYSIDTDKFYCHMPTGATLPYVGRPFATNILDCLTLTQDYIRGEFGIEIFPEFIDRSGKWWRRGLNLFEDNIPWDKVVKITDRKLKKHDTLFFAMGETNDIINHCGIYLGGGKILHHLVYRLSTEDNLGDYMKDLKLAVRLNHLV